ncbi:WecB/TagA/CpsF family glycosyltransferase [Hydrogenophaga sp. XSHU_21]
MNQTCLICGVPVSRQNMQEVLGELLDRAAHGSGAWILTLNTEMLARFTREPGYRELVAEADIITADGMPLVWASRMRGPQHAIPERTTGVDLVHAFMQQPSLPRYAIIGGVDPAATLGRYGSIAIEACGYLFNGRVDLSDAQTHEFVDRLRAERIRVLFVALGVPKQDRLALKLRAAMPELTIVGVGGTFEILGPTGRRAPRWMQMSGLEWLYRFAQEPRRLWKRYVLQYPFGLGLLATDTLKVCAASRKVHTRPPA